MRDHLVIVGSLNQDLVVNLARFPAAGETVSGETLRTFCGGKGANQAVAVAQLGGHATMVGQIGADAAGEAQVESLRSAGVHVHHIRRHRGVPTGTAVIAVDSSGENRIIVVPGANGSYHPADLEQSRAAIAEAAVLLVQLEIPLATVLRAIETAREGGARVILDPAPAQPLPDTIFPQVDFLTPNLSELACLTGDPISEESTHEEVIRSARKLCARGAGRVVAKLGARGAILVSAQTAEPVRAFRVEVVDTTAAGDCFAGALATGLVAGMSEGEACRFASAAAALSVTRHGAQPSMPSLAEVESLLAANP